MNLWDERCDCLYKAAPDIIDELEQQVPYASLSFTVERGYGITVDGQDIKFNLPMSETGATVSIFDGVGWYESGTNDLAPGSIRQKALALIKALPSHGSEEPVPRKSIGEHSFSVQMEIDPDSIPLEQKIADLLVIRDHAKKQSSVGYTSVGYSELRLCKVFVDRSRRLKQELSYVGAFITVYVSEGNTTQYVREGNMGSGGYELLTRYISPERIENAVRNARALLKAESVRPGMHTIVAAPLISGVIAHEAFGHGVEMDMFVNKCARAQSYIGKQVASPLITMFDSPTQYNSSGHYFFDDEGELASSVKIIEDGILCAGLTDTFSARKLRAPHTANGRRESYRRKVFARMSNTFITPGKASLDDLISSVEDGIYLFDGGSGMEDPLGWGIQINIHAGEEIKSGKRTGKLFSPLVLTGYVPDLLTSITGVGREFDMSGLGRCGKTFRKDWILVGCGGPSLLLEGRLT